MIIFLTALLLFITISKENESISMCEEYDIRVGNVYKSLNKNPFREEILLQEILEVKGDYYKYKITHNTNSYTGSSMCSDFSYSYKLIKTNKKDVR